MLSRLNAPLIEPAVSLGNLVASKKTSFGLLAKIEDDHGGCRSLTKFLRYNPINEFEQPFFKSLGLKPSELYIPSAS
ncbi:hypothetical protein GW17_00026944 [Ensete ventricosum]|nr:hypothetical protein GW17_00026944 [Ensete ventricosum]